MKLTEEKLREIAIAAVNELGEKATPELVRKAVERAVNKITGSEEVQKISDNNSGRAILTSFGVNHPGIVSSVSKLLSECNCDILDISQKIMQEFFTMIMLIDITNSPKDLKEIQEEMNKIAQDLKIKIYVQHEDLFRYMHRI